jgi:hypothetical protein
MESLEAITECWVELLQGSLEMNEVLSRFLSEEEQPDFFFPGFTRFVVLSPHFMTGHNVSTLKAASEAVLSAHAKILDAVLGDKDLKSTHFSDFLAWTEKVLDLDQPGPIHATCLRLDGSFKGGRPVFLELNADMPQGIGINDSFSGFLSSLPFFDEFEGKHPTSAIPIRDLFLQALLTEWAAWGSSRVPRICLITWHDDPVRLKDMHLNAGYFASQGVETLVADPRDLEFNGVTLAANGKAIDLVYRVVSTAETLLHPDEMEALILAEKSGAVLSVNSFRSELLGNKTMFALLQDEDFQHLLTSEERSAVRNSIPWTRIMRDGHDTDPAGDPIDLAAWVLDHRKELVLKPSHDFGGHGVTLGSLVSGREWSSAASNALENDFIVQKKAELGVGWYPIAEEGMPLKEMYEDIDPYILHNRFSGCLTRLSEDEMTNIHLHGALGANFILT